MFAAVFYHHQEEMWLNEHKATFDGVNKRVLVNDGVTAIDVKKDIYSAWKEWLLAGNMQFDPAIRTIGGDSTVLGQNAGDIYFLINSWTVVIDFRKTTVTGVLFSDDFTTPWLNSDDLAPISPALVSSLVTGTDVNAGAPSANDNAVAVWDFLEALVTTSGSIGQVLKDARDVINGVDTTVTASAAKVSDLWEKEGLNISNPITITPTSIKTGDSSIDLILGGDGITSTTVTRQ